MTDRTPPSSRHLYLDIARVFAILSITCYHAFSRFFALSRGQVREFLNHAVPYTIGKSALYVFCRLGVPVFLMISGALLLNKRMEQERDITRFYKHNLLGLFITAEIWYVIMYWVIILLDPANTLLADRGIVGALLGMVKTMLFMDQVTMGSMWYMPMILCLYTTIPLVILAKSKLPSRSLLLPVGLVYLLCMVLPAVNTVLALIGQNTYTSALSQANLVSMYYIYVIIGYGISRGALEKLRDWQVGALALLTFAAATAYQFLAFSRTKTYIGYDFPLLPLCAAFILEWLRRKAHWFRAIQRPITYLAKIAFGIYFVHIILMSLLVWYMDFTGWYPYVKVVFLEVTSFAGSVLFIALLSKLRPLRKYMFLIKD